MGGKCLTYIGTEGSAVKWSGEKEYNKVDIAPHSSYFFLDLVAYSISERYDICSYYEGREDVPWGLLDPKYYSDNVYWAVWVDRSYPRGIHEKFTWEGYVELNYYVMADNCKPTSFTALMLWQRSRWNKPEICIKRGGVK